MNRKERLVECYARLQALRLSLPAEEEVPATYVQEYREILDLLERVTGIRLEGFMVEATEASRNFLAEKILGLVKFFEILSTPGLSIRFAAPGPKRSGISMFVRRLLGMHAEALPPHFAPIAFCACAA